LYRNQFRSFLDVENYSRKNIKTTNIIDNTIIHINDDVTEVNMYYDTDIQNVHRYRFKLAIAHHNLKIKDDYEYYQRCIHRLYELFKTDIQKYYIHFHAIMGINDFHNNKHSILNEFDNFNQYIIGKTQNIFGIYFILIKCDKNIKSIQIKKKDMKNYTVFVIFCNRDFIDGGGSPFMGNHNIEEEEILAILKSIMH
jgi:hypothetical protein